MIKQSVQQNNTKTIKINNYKVSWVENLKKKLILSTARHKGILNSTSKKTNKNRQSFSLTTKCLLFTALFSQHNFTLMLFSGIIPCKKKKKII